MGPLCAPGNRASTLTVPGLDPRVSIVEASPSASDTEELADRGPLPDVISHSTSCPGTGLPSWSPTYSTSGSLRGVLTGPDWPSPEAMRTWSGRLGIAVAVKITGDP